MEEFIIKKVEKKNYIQFTCRIEEELLDKLEELSYKNNHSINSLINDCIKFVIDNMKIEQEF